MSLCDLGFYVCVYLCICLFCFVFSLRLNKKRGVLELIRFFLTVPLVWLELLIAMFRKEK
ncbi:hypothetical protein DSN94_02645 [Campylobacter upsaliensis]|nr:hypothetical protein [Campylobacter upsaliensis]EAH5218124.1 hypothetical protein [Campylobacter upsaliensis]EAH6866957.1 hypothetical protein [Campylobacter upsaliensis]EAH7597661.1 hypothetical protein [Campylobacter upsaliensis]EAL3928112.1 hypothetical protein [Campylobacter upsaliensis]